MPWSRTDFGFMFDLLAVHEIPEVRSHSSRAETGEISSSVAMLRL